jgi:hypothetical protein
MPENSRLMSIQGAAQQLANSPLFWVALIAGLLVLYLLPSLIGAIRKVEGLGCPNPMELWWIDTETMVMTDDATARAGELAGR